MEAQAPEVTTEAWTSTTAEERERDYRFIAKAVAEAYRAAECGGGNPFGAVVARGDEEVVSSHNSVRKDTDPSAHAELTAIRQACKKLGRIDLSDCEIYASCEPCPMCLGLIRLSKIKVRWLVRTSAFCLTMVSVRSSCDCDCDCDCMQKVVYGAKAEVAAAAGFSSAIPAAFVEHYRRSGMEIRQAEGGAARMAEEVFEKTAKGEYRTK